MINWLEEVQRRKDNLIRDTQDFLRIKSVLDEEQKGTAAPFGLGIKDALEFALNLSEKFGMSVKNIDGYAGHAEIGQGEELVGILCHVDVVPEGDGWLSPPFSAEIRDGKIYARGAIDDKGPTMAAIYAMKIINDLNLKLNKRVRIILGTDEESHWRGIKYYFEREEMPNIGFAPDADFPIIVAEKGIGNIELSKYINNENYDSEKIRVVLFNAGERPNMVPDLATVILEGNNSELENINHKFADFLSGYEHGGYAELNGKYLTLKLYGISAHAMEPFKGVNAALELIHFLNSFQNLRLIDEWIEWVDNHLYRDYYGKKLNISYSDDITGSLTINPSVFQVNDKEIKFNINIRYPVTTDFPAMLKMIEKFAKKIDFEIKVTENLPPHNVDKEHFLIKTLQQVYKEHTGQEATLLSIGGGTFARALQNGVAYGPLFPGKEETAHQKDEYIEIEDILKATAIYAQAIYELAK